MGILGTLVGGGIGAAIGFFVPGIGPALGFAIGASIGGAVSAGDVNVQEGRINDLRATGASFGDAISRVYGTIRLPVQIIWTSGIIEKKEVSSSGNLFLSGTETTTFKYVTHIAFLICAGPITGIRKIWMNNKMVYNLADDADPTQVLVSKKIARSITVYLGDEAQLPDPFLEDQIGAGLVPAHRGAAYIVIEKLKLKEYFNKIPNIEVEVIKDNPTGPPPFIVNTLTATRDISIGIYDGGTIFGAILSTAGLDPDYEVDHIVTRTDMFGEILESTTYEIRRPVTAAGATRTLCKNEPNAMFFSNIVGAVNTAIFWQGIKLAEVVAASWTAPIGTTAEEAYSSFGDTIKLGGFYITVAGTGASGDGFIRYIADGGKPTFNWDKAALFADLFSTAYSNNYISADPDDENIFWHVMAGGPGDQANYINKFDIDFNLLNTWGKTAANIPVTNQDSREFLLGQGFMLKKRTAASSEVDYFTFDADVSESDWTLVGSVNTTSGGFHNAIPLGNNLVMVKNEIVTLSDLQGRATQPLADIVSEICLDAGYTAGQIDVTDLVGDVRGYRIPGPISARASIEQLQKVFYFDGTEVDDKLTWIMRGGSSVATIPEDEMAAHPVGSSMPDLFNMDRQAVLELPHTVKINYLDESRNYEQGSQYSRRLVTNAKGVATISVNVVLSPDDAAQSADVLLYNAHQESEAFDIRLSSAYQYLVPTDLVTIPVGGENLTVRIIEQSRSQDGWIKFSVVDEFTPIYTQARSGADPGSTVDDDILVNGAALLAFLDIPILNDSDDNVGVYAGAAGYLTTWGGHTLHRYIDATVSYSQVASFVDEATAGNVTTTLADHVGGSIDYTNTVTVKLANSAQSLSSSTESAVIQDGAINRFALGRDTRWELLQFITATDNMDGTWTLSGLLRARHGTDYATDDHDLSDTFVMLDNAWIQRLIMDSGDIGIELTYKFVGIDESIDLIGQDIRTIQGISKQPFMPAHISAEQSGSDWVIDWIERSRLNSDLISNVTVDDDPEIESYTVDILDGASIARSTSITVGTETWTYTSAMQGDDFGGDQSDIVFNVYQNGTTVGEGYGLNLDTSTGAVSIVPPKA